VAGEISEERSGVTSGFTQRNYNMLELKYLRNHYIELSAWHPLTGEMLVSCTQRWCPIYAASNKYMLLDVPFLHEAANISMRRNQPSLKKPIRMRILASNEQQA